jgi:hypothetical protein
MDDGAMNGRAHQRGSGDALATALREQAGAERYQRRQRQVRRGRAAAVDHPRPLEFDKGGFPIPQRTPSFVARVARLLNPQ